MSKLLIQLRFQLVDAFRVSDQDNSVLMDASCPV